MASASPPTRFPSAPSYAGAAALPPASSYLGASAAPAEDSLFGVPLPPRVELAEAPRALGGDGAYSLLGGGESLVWGGLG